MSARPARILFLHHTAMIGGAELHLLSVARHYRATSLVILFADGPFRHALEAAGVRVKVFPGSWAMSGIRLGPPEINLRNLITVISLAWRCGRAASGMDLVCANSPKALLVARIARLVRRKPLIWFLHDLLTENHFSPKAIRLLVRGANASVSWVLANSRATAAAFTAAGGRANFVRVVHCGVGEFPGSERAPNTRSLGMFGRITPWKGHDVVLHALAKVPTCTALFVGAEEDRAYADGLHRLALELRIAERVQFLGFRDDIPEMMQAVSCVVHASTEPEPFGRVIVEAMLARRPVIATRGGGVEEIIQDGVSGLLVRPGEVDELARALQRIFSDPAEAARLVENGYKRAREQFSEERMLAAIERNLEEILSRK